jgi:hypothetical protein
MKKHPHPTAGTFFLIGTLAVAQAPKSKIVQPREASSGQAAGMAVDHAGGNGVRRMAGDNTGATNAQGATAGPSAPDAAQRKSGSIIVLDREGAAQRKNGSIIHADFPRSADRSSAHATESLSPSNKAGTSENPLYKDGGKSGNNPLYEGKDAANSKPGTGASNAQPYKDSEDMTTRYRPENNKTTKAAPGGKASKVDSLSIKQ